MQVEDLSAKTSKPTNRLALEKSPYLQQHQHNPVDWYAWGEEAFGKARAEDRPIFLSIGYSTCHWCHVMERESFENEETARFLNDNFVSIKVDREERPDLDGIYMKALTQILRQPGGWPMSMWLTPDLRPFFGGTYFPPEDRWGRPGFQSVLKRVIEAWRERRQDILEDAATVTGLLGEVEQRTPAGMPAADVIDRAIRTCARAWDGRYGGLQGAPKFPQPPLVEFLLRQFERDAEALDLARIQLDHMADGGIYDHLGGGFARYSTDERWLVPHFEKMLYDNAQLLRLYAEAFLITGNQRYANTAAGTALYLLRDLGGPEGSFCAAEDADSEGIEGKFYAWRREEVTSVLGQRDAEVFSLAYDVSDAGNWVDTHNDTLGLNVLNRRLDSAQVARVQGIDEVSVDAILSRSRVELLRVRGHRPRPLRDQKVLTSWNGLAISGLAIAGRALADTTLITAAAAAAGFASNHLYVNGKLLHRFCDGEARFDGNLDDYAFLAQGLLDLYETCFEPHGLLLARELILRTLELFRDPDSGGFFYTPAGRDDVLARRIEATDGAEPSGYSVATLNLIRLAEMSGSTDLGDRAREAFGAFGRHMEKAPLGFPGLLQAFDHLRGPSRQIVLAGELGAEQLQGMIKEIHSRILPRTVVLHASAGLNETEFPSLKGKDALDGQPTAYVCVDFACREPVTNVDGLRRLIRGE